MWVGRQSGWRARRISLVALLLVLVASPASAQEGAAPAAQTDWGVAIHDIAPDPAVRQGVLANGLRYAILPNDRPPGAVSIRLAIDAGWIDERDSELGLAHFVEHMAFNGSARVPEGEMVKLLEREGLAFGADTNASTGFEQTIYRLDLPGSDPALIDTALMLMRETASELTLAPEAIERERGVLAAEARTRETYAARRTRHQLEFLAPGTVFARQFRNPAVRANVAQAAASDLAGFYRRLYRPDNALLVVAGEVDPDRIEERIASHFGDWQAPGEGMSRTQNGRIDVLRRGEAANFVDPDSEYIVRMGRFAPYSQPVDTIADTRRRMLVSLGTSMLTRRLERIATDPGAPILGGNASLSDFFELADFASLTLQARDGEWAGAIARAEQEWRRAILHGFTIAELAEQLANFGLTYRTSAEQAAARRNEGLASTLLAAAKNERLVVTPATRLAIFEQIKPDLTLEAVNYAFREVFGNDGDPLIHVSTPTAIAGGPEAILAAFRASRRQLVEPPASAPPRAFAYDDFGQPGLLAEDLTIEGFGYRQLRFANNVRLNLKRTDFEPGRVRYTVRIGSGMLAIPDDRMAASTLMSNAMAQGGLGRHSFDELRAIMAGRNVDYGIGVGNDRFGVSGSTTRADLPLQLAVSSAYLTDPGYRPEALARFRAFLPSFFARADASPQAASSFAVPALLTDNNPRFGTPPRPLLETVTMDDLQAVVAREFAEAPIEIAVVGDIDEAEVIAAVARTFGALPARKLVLGLHSGARQAAFTGQRGEIVLTHAGQPDQALVHLYWPLTDDDDAQEEASVRLLAEVMGLVMAEEIREQLGASYSPSASAAMSDTFEGFGTFAASALVAPDDADAVLGAMRAIANRLATTPVDDDVLERARRPMIERLAMSRKDNGYWLGLLSEAQLRADRLDRYRTYEARLRAVTPEALRIVAARYLVPGNALAIRIVHESLASGPAK